VGSSASPASEKLGIIVPMLDIRIKKRHTGPTKPIALFWSPVPQRGIGMAKGTLCCISFAELPATSQWIVLDR
jgi:hypothetical protein